MKTSKRLSSADNIEAVLCSRYELPDPEGVDFYVLKYDGGQQTAIVIDKREDETLEIKNFPDNTARKAYQRKQKEYNFHKHYEFEKNFIEIRAGIKHIPIMYHGKSTMFPPEKEKYTKRGWEALNKLLACCGEDIASRREVWQLVTAILAGYWVRVLFNESLLPEKGGDNFRAPILSCTRRDGTEDTLIRIVESLALDTAEPIYEDSKICQVIPPVLPETLNEHQIEDSAYIRLVDCYSEEKDRLIYYDGEAPAQYRDTAVMLRGRFYTPKAVIDFQQRNRWASILLFTTPDSELLTDPIRLNGAVFANGKYAEEWSEEDIAQMVKLYTDSILEKREKGALEKYLGNVFEKYRDWIAVHNHKRGTEKIRGLKYDWLVTQLLVAETLPRAIGKLLNWSQEIIYAQANAWCNLLLPGCCEIPDTPEAQKLREEMLSPEDDAINACQEVIKQMLSDDTKATYCYVPRIKEYTGFDKAATCYVREYEYKREKRKALTLQIREQSFADYAKSYRNANWLLVIDGLRKKAPDWLLPVKTVRMPWIGDKQEKALVIEIDRMNFLTEEQRRLLQGLSQTE